jgi:hypothetical protein
LVEPLRSLALVELLVYLALRRHVLAEREREAVKQ